MTQTVAATPAEKPKAVPPDKSLESWTRAELTKWFPKEPPKPLEKYSIEELSALKGLGPAVLGGALYHASQKTAAVTGGGILGPAITSKGFTPVPDVG